MILFHHPNDVETPLLYRQYVVTELSSERCWWKYVVKWLLLLFAFYRYSPIHSWVWSYSLWELKSVGSGLLVTGASLMIKQVTGCSDIFVMITRIKNENLSNSVHDNENKSYLQYVNRIKTKTIFEKRMWATFLTERNSLTAN